MTNLLVQHTELLTLTGDSHRSELTAEDRAGRDRASDESECLRNDLYLARADDPEPATSGPVVVMVEQVPYRTSAGQGPSCGRSHDNLVDEITFWAGDIAPGMHDARHNKGRAGEFRGQHNARFAGLEIGSKNNRSQDAAAEAVKAHVCTVHGRSPQGCR